MKIIYGTCRNSTVEVMLKTLPKIDEIFLLLSHDHFTS